MPIVVALATDVTLPLLTCGSRLAVVEKLHLVPTSLGSSFQIEFNPSILNAFTDSLQLQKYVCCATILTED
jgi:hypothetical protein